MIELGLCDLRARGNAHGGSLLPGITWRNESLQRELNHDYLTQRLLN